MIVCMRFFGLLQLGSCETKKAIGAMILDLASVTNNIYQMLIEDLSCEMNLHDVITVFFFPLGFLWHNVETLLWDSSAEGHCCNSLHLLNHTGHI